MVLSTRAVSLQCPLPQCCSSLTQTKSALVCHHILFAHELGVVVVLIGWVDSGDMDAQIGGVGEWASTDGTGEWLLTTMCPAVTLQEPTAREATSTVDTTKWHCVGGLV